MNIPNRKRKQLEELRMRIRIERIYGTYYDPAFDKYVMIARVYVNGTVRNKRLFFNTEKELKDAEKGSWIEY